MNLRAWWSMKTRLIKLKHWRLDSILSFIGFLIQLADPLKSVCFLFLFFITIKSKRKKRTYDIIADKRFLNELSYLHFIIPQAFFLLSCKSLDSFLGKTALA